MSKLKSTGLGLIVFSLAFFGAPAAKFWLGGIQPAAALEMDKKGKEPTKTIDYNNPQKTNNPKSDFSMKPPAPAEKPKSKW
jgi:hypothetical protein